MHSKSVTDYSNTALVFREDLIHVGLALWAPKLGTPFTLHRRKGNFQFIIFIVGTEFSPIYTLRPSGFRCILESWHDIFSLTPFFFLLAVL